MHRLVRFGLLFLAGATLSGSALAGPDPIEAASSNVIKGPAFQLTYRATRSVILPKAEWPKLIEADRKDLISQGVEAKVADRMVADTLRDLARPPLTYEVTFAHGPRQFYYMEDLVGESLTEARKARRLVYYDGVQTFHLLGNTLHIVPGLDLRGVNFQPLFGAGFADLKLAQPGQPTEEMERVGWQKEKFAMVFMSSFERDGFGAQVPGYVETAAVNGKTVFQAITVGHTTDFLSKLRFADYKAEPVGFLAHQVEIRQFLTKSRLPAAKPTPRELVKLELISARAEESSFRSPQIRDLMRTGDPIFVGEGSTRQTKLYQPDDAEIIGLFRDRTVGGTINQDHLTYWYAGASVIALSGLGLVFAGAKKGSVR